MYPNGPDWWIDQYADVEITEDRWIKAMEIKPSNPKVVHHVVIYVIEPDAPEGTPETGVQLHEYAVGKYGDIYGENTGRHRVIDALATLAFDYPPRSPFFRGELEQFLLMSREESLDPLAPTGSYAGAMGVPQFMPSTFRAYAVDGDGDGRRNLWASWGDVFASVANYLLKHGWRSGEPVMAPADASDADLAGLELGKLALSETVGSLRARGVRFETPLPADAGAAAAHRP
jgi:hypothetical protein